MTKTLTKHGNSYALIIDKPLMEMLNIEPETPLNLSTDGKTLIISAEDPARRKKIDVAMKQIMTEWHDVFKKLAE